MGNLPGTTFELQSTQNPAKRWFIPIPTSYDIELFLPLILKITDCTFFSFLNDDFIISQFFSDGNTVGNCCY